MQLFIEKAEDIAVESISNNIDFAPYIYYGIKKIKRMNGDSLGESIKLAEEEIDNMDDETVVLVFQDLVKLNDGSFNAIISQIYNQDEDYGYSFGLIYRIENGMIKFLNKRVFLGNIRNCLVF